jgi:hypothetical protein
MSIPLATGAAPSRRLGRSVAAVALGFVAVFVLSLGTDQILHVLQVYPPWGQPMFDPRLNALALGYRLVYDTFGSYLMARLAPHSPMGHALVGGVLALILCTVGVFVTLPLNIGPAWYPIALAVSALPTAWLGGALYLGRSAPAAGVR